MQIVNIHEAKTQLSRLLADVERGESILRAALGAGALGAMSSLSFAAGASGSAKRFVFVVLRGKRKSLIFDNRLREKEKESVGRPFLHSSY